MNDYITQPDGIYKKIDAVSEISDIQNKIDFISTQRDFIQKNLDALDFQEKDLAEQLSKLQDIKVEQVKVDSVDI